MKKSENTSKSWIDGILLHRQGPASDQSSLDPAVVQAQSPSPEVLLSSPSSAASESALPAVAQEQSPPPVVLSSPPPSAASGSDLSVPMQNIENKWILLLLYYNSYFYPLLAAGILPKWEKIKNRIEDKSRNLQILFDQLNRTNLDSPKSVTKDLRKYYRAMKKGWKMFRLLEFRPLRIPPIKWNLLLKSSKSTWYSVVQNKLLQLAQRDVAIFKRQAYLFLDHYIVGTVAWSQFLEDIYQKEPNVAAFERDVDRSQLLSVEQETKQPNDVTNLKNQDDAARAEKVAELDQLLEKLAPKVNEHRSNAKVIRIWHKILRHYYAPTIDDRKIYTRLIPKLQQSMTHQSSSS